MRHGHFAMLLLLAGSFVHADDYKIIKLEQDLRNLERQVQVLSRQVEELKLATRSGGPAASAARAAAPASTAWLSASSWERIRPGMNELEVISALGPPTSMRVDGEQRTLLYAIEIGVGGFLSGSVTLQDRKVVDLQPPTLR